MKIAFALRVIEYVAAGGTGTGSECIFDPGRKEE